MHSFTHASVRALRAEIDAALKQVADKHGLIMGLGNARFSPTEMHFTKLSIVPKVTPTVNSLQTASTPSATSNGVDPYQTLEIRAFISLAFQFGLKKEWLGKQFLGNGGTRYTIVGLKPSYRKYPVIAVGPQGGRYKIPADTVRRGIIL